MFLRHVCLLLLAGCLTLVDGSQDSRGEVVQCVSSQCDKPCPTRPTYCKSGIIEKCGCCHVCWIHLREGQQCRKFVPENTLCGPHLVCGSSGRCERQAEQNADKSDNSSKNSESPEEDPGLKSNSALKY